MSFVWGAGNVSFLREALQGDGRRNHLLPWHGIYRGPQQIADWAPLVMDGRGDDEPFAATRIVTGTDVDYGSLTHLLVEH